MWITKDKQYKRFLLKNILPSLDYSRIDDLLESDIEDVCQHLNSYPIKYYKCSSNGVVIYIKVSSHIGGGTIERIQVDIDEIQINSNTRGIKLREEFTQTVEETFSYTNIEEIQEPDYEDVLVRVEQILNL